MTPSAIAAAARLLSEARRSAPQLDALPDALPESCSPATLDDAHAIQEATAAQLGEAIGGWKVGAALEGGIARGALLASRMHASDARLPAARMPLLGVEAEIAFRLDRDLPARDTDYTYEEFAAAVTALPGIEVVDSRFRGYPNAPLLDRIAVVCGAPQPRWREIDLESLAVELSIDGRTIVRHAGGHPTKDPLLPAVALINDLRTRAGVRAGQILTTGSYTGLNFAMPGQSVIASFAGFDAVRVKFE
jgi:2-keto-4-pentenoate hydratase